MSAQVAIQICLYSGLIPAATALAAFFASGRLLPVDVARRYRLATSFALAVFVGFAVSPTTEAVWPLQFWEWIPYLGVLAAFVGGVTLAVGITHGERLASILVVAGAAAWTIVPGWERLAEVRLYHVGAAAAGIAALAMLLEPLADRLTGRALPFWLTLAAATCAILVLSEWSETIGRSAALPAGALAGCGVAMLLTKSDRNDSMRSLALPYAVVVGCYAYVGYVYPSPPLTLLLIPPFAPLALWICACGPLARLNGVRAVLVQAVCIAVPLTVAILIVLSRSAGDEW